jgi:ATP-binding cassette subfamily B multidrug efflux pump
VLFSIGAVMLWLNWRLALATFSVLPLILVSTWLFRDRVRDANRRIRTAIARINAFLQEHISGMSVVQLFNREGKAQDQFAELNRIHMQAYKDVIFAFAVFFPVVELLSTAAIAIVYWYGGLRSLAGLVDVGVLITFMQYAQRFFLPIQDLSEKFNILQSAMAACERIFKLLDEPVLAAPAEATLPLVSPHGEIEFRNVWFAYNGGAHPRDEDWVLRDVSFHIAPGQTLAIVGHTGAGKSSSMAWIFAAITCRSCGASSASCSRTRSSSPAPSNRTSAWATGRSLPPESNAPSAKWDSALCWIL